MLRGLFQTTNYSDSLWQLTHPHTQAHCALTQERGRALPLLAAPLLQPLIISYQWESAFLSGVMGVGEKAENNGSNYRDPFEVFKVMTNEI